MRAAARFGKSDSPAFGCMRAEMRRVPLNAPCALRCMDVSAGVAGKKKCFSDFLPDTQPPLAACRFMSYAMRRTPHQCGSLSIKMKINETTFFVSLSFELRSSAMAFRGAGREENRSFIISNTNNAPIANALPVCVGRYF